MTEVYPLQVSHPESGQLSFDRPLPLLCLHQRSGKKHEMALDWLARGAPNHLVYEDEQQARAVAKRVERLCTAARDQYGACVIAAVEAGPGGRDDDVIRVEIETDGGNQDRWQAGIDAFRGQLDRPLFGFRPEVDVRPGAVSKINGLFGLAEDDDIHNVRIRVDPVFVGEGGQVRRLLLNLFNEHFQRALLAMCFHFVNEGMRRELSSSAALGRRQIAPEVGALEAELSSISRSYDLILQLTPRNGTEACGKFLSGACEKPPHFVYRPIDVDPDLLKRRLYALPIEHVEDPAMARILAEQREHIANQLDMLAHRNTDRCLYASLHVYGPAEDKLYRQALSIAEDLEVDQAEERQVRYDAEAFRKLAQEEIAHYQRQGEGILGTATIRSDVSSLTVSEDHLLIPADLNVSEPRVRALLAHEVGTHLVTYWNGGAQPLALMRTGLAGYEQLQEGLAVVAEYLAGGLTRQRMRLLAARVIAVRHLLNRGTFVDVHRKLRDKLDLSATEAFTVTMRVFRGGGFTKDAIYLRGLGDVLKYVSRGKPLERLFSGKFAAYHTDLVDELFARKVLKPPLVVPRVLTDPAGMERLEKLRAGRPTIFELCERMSA